MEELLRLPVESKNEIKNLENIKQKLLNAKWFKIFNEMCIKNLYIDLCLDISDRYKTFNLISVSHFF